jgi:hypothetical protein
MPDYIPQANLGPATALAQQANQLTANKPSPWAALLNGIAPYFQEAGKAAIQGYAGSSSDTSNQSSPSYNSGGSALGGLNLNGFQPGGQYNSSSPSGGYSWGGGASVGTW